jgi:hypothetical protein
MVVYDYPAKTQKWYCTDRPDIYLAPYWIMQNTCQKSKMAGNSAYMLSDNPNSRVPATIVKMRQCIFLPIL